MQAGLFFGDVNMIKSSRLQFESELDIDELIMNMYRAAGQRGMKAKRVKIPFEISMGYPNKGLMVDDILIYFEWQDSGCSVSAVVNKKILTENFVEFWKQFEAEALGAEGIILQVENARDVEADQKGLDMEGDVETTKTNSLVEESVKPQIIIDSSFERRMIEENEILDFYVDGWLDRLYVREKGDSLEEFIQRRKKNNPSHKFVGVTRVEKRIREWGSEGRAEKRNGYWQKK
jgi:hypothetical protein